MSYSDGHRKRPDAGANEEIPSGSLVVLQGLVEGVI